MRPVNSPQMPNTNADEHEAIEGEAPNPFDPWSVDQPTMAILLAAAGWHWDYWGKFYGPEGKYRDPRWVLHAIRSSWKCSRCDCDPGCPCCGPQDCRKDNWMDPGSPFVAVRHP